MDAKEKLKQFYSKKSKHSNYQVLPATLKKLIGQDEIETKTRYEKERLAYILTKIDVKDKTVLDIGGNTGFFTFELVAAGAKRVHLFEGEKTHANFVELAARATGLTDSIRVTNDYYQFDTSPTKEHYDIVLLLNVLHHVGDDYGDKNMSIEQAKDKIIEQLNNLKDRTSLVVFQLGFNWHGNPKTGLFKNGTKTEMIDFVKKGTGPHWQIKHIGIAQKNSKVQYEELNEKNIARDDELGEFLNRPLLILERKH